MKINVGKHGNSWYFGFEMQRVNGKRKQCRKYGFPTKESAYQAGIEHYRVMHNKKL